MDFSGNTTNTGTSTNQRIAAKTVDTILSKSPLTLYLLGNQKKWDQGAQMKFPIKYASNSDGLAFDGLEKFNTNKQSPFANMYFDPTGYGIASVVSGIEEDVNAVNPSVNLRKRQLESDVQELADDIAGLFYTAQTGKNFLSLVDATDDKVLSSEKSLNSVKLLMGNAKDNTELNQYGKCNDYGKQTSIKRNYNRDGIGRWFNQAFQQFLSTFIFKLNFA